MTESANRSLQEHYFPELRCFGCGPANPKGLRLRSFATGDGSIEAVFAPWPEHDNGLGYLNGGIIATVLDCHSAAAMMVTAEQRGLVPDGTLPYVTAGIDVRYRRPSPLHEAVELIARPASSAEDEILIEAEVWWEGLVRATARSTWKRWRTRDRVVAPH